MHMDMKAHECSFVVRVCTVCIDYVVCVCMVYVVCVVWSVRHTCIVCVFLLFVCMCGVWFSHSL